MNRQARVPISNSVQSSSTILETCDNAHRQACEPHKYGCLHAPHGNAKSEAYACWRCLRDCWRSRRGRWRCGFGQRGRPAGQAIAGAGAFDCGERGALQAVSDAGGRFALRRLHRELRAERERGELPAVGEERCGRGRRQRIPDPVGASGFADRRGHGRCDGAM
jgi:hypothetical protein